MSASSHVGHGHTKRSSTIGCALGCGHAKGSLGFLSTPPHTETGFVLKHRTHRGNRALSFGPGPNEHSKSSKSHRGHERPSHGVTSAPWGSAYVSFSVTQCSTFRARVCERRRKRAQRPHFENGGASANDARADGSNLSSNKESTASTFFTKCAYFNANCSSACRTTSAWSAFPVAIKSS